MALKISDDIDDPSVLQYSSRSVIDNDDHACIACGKENTLRFDDSRGETICESCGCVNEQHAIDTRKEWRSYNSEEDQKRSRCGPSANKKIYDEGLSTRIGSGNKDCNGNTLSASMNYQINYLRKLDEHTKPNHSMYNNYSNAISDLERIAVPNILDLNKNIQEQIASMYKKLLNSCFFKNYNSHFILLALSYRVCQEQHDIRTIYEIVTRGKIKTRKFTEYLTRILDFFALTPIRSPPEDYLKRIVKILKITDTQIFLLARKICQFVDNIAEKDIKLTTGKEPSGIAGASLYFACKIYNYPCTQHQIAKAINITEVTIRGRLNDILLVLDCPPEEYWGKLSEWITMTSEQKKHILSQYVKPCHRKSD